MIEKLKVVTDANPSDGGCGAQSAVVIAAALPESVALSVEAETGNDDGHGSGESDDGCVGARLEQATHSDEIRTATDAAKGDVGRRFHPGVKGVAVAERVDLDLTVDAGIECELAVSTEGAQTLDDCVGGGAHELDRQRPAGVSEAQPKLGFVVEDPAFTFHQLTSSWGGASRFAAYVLASVA